MKNGLIDPIIHEAFTQLLAWCRQHDFAGHDPFDALNSKLFQATPLRNSAAARLLWTQALKRSPINLRQVTRVSPGKNPKGIALFALAALAEFRRTRSKDSEREARQLLEQLIDLRLETEHGIAWGYNFDWQSRVFFAPQGTPTIVPTAFAAKALLQASVVIDDKSYLELGRRVCNFIVSDLKRSVDTEAELCFSYTPTASTRVFNASLLAAETLARVVAIDQRRDYSDLAVRAARYVLNQQREDGSWVYGAGDEQAWVDNFHTAYVLSSLKTIGDCCEAARTDELRKALQRGYGYWKKGFFLADGRAKYYHDTLYPVDSHAAAVAIVTFLDLLELDLNALPLAKRTADWTIQHLQDRQGFFYYQLRRFFTVRMPFVRWTQAWMLYALARLLEEQARES